MEGDDVVGTSAPPEGWYPDPGGAPQWRRWLGTTWGDTTMPYAPRPPDAQALAREQECWSSLRPLARVAIGAPAVAAISLAAESPRFAVARRWVHAYFEAVLHHRATPSLPATAVPQSSTVDSLVTIAVTILGILGLFAWLRFSAQAIRVAAAAKYPQRHGPVAASASLLVPLIGPLVASAASRANLPAGHEARSVLSAGFALVVAGEAAYLALNATELWTASLGVTWIVASVCVIAWGAAAYVLPLGLAAIAEDHETLAGRLVRTS